MQALILHLERVGESIGRAVAWLTTLLMLLMAGDVLFRYLFDLTAVWVLELEWHLFALLFLLGAAYTLKHDQHVRVDVFYAKLGPKAQAWINLLGTLLFLFPFCLVIIWASWNYAATSFQIGEGSPDPGGLPARFLVKACIPLGFCLLLLQGLALATKSLLVIKSDA
jgi:TRAP-type mannitol/chloroaromatic compound transport system permease small subunit